MGSDSEKQQQRQATEFQSTLPAWGATLEFLLCIFLVNISIHAPRVGSDSDVEHCNQHFAISIHAPRVGSDARLPVSAKSATRFQSTLPAWGATVKLGTQQDDVVRFQSTLPAWGATRALQSSTCPPNFNPRSPRGERLKSILRPLASILFQSTLPAWGATLTGLPLLAPSIISIHAPRVGSDVDWLAIAGTLDYFNPRSPRGERLIYL